MSKLDYSKSLSEIIYPKLKSVDYSFPSLLLEDDKLYVLSLCIAYLTLSKEKIISKDKKNNNRLGRLTKFVKKTDIDTLFDNSFSDKMPLIIETQENDNLWILDNFRDSIMHGVFDVDLEKEEIIINNCSPERRLKAIIPFEWLFKYAKYDIRSKKEKEKYSFVGMYKDFEINKDKKYSKEQILESSIFYRVFVQGSKFNIKQVEDRIRELFEDDYIANINIDDDPFLTEGYLPFESFSERTFASFTAAELMIRNKIKKEFGLDVTISIMRDNIKLHKKIKKNLDNSLRSYDELYKDINNLCIKKSDKMLDMLSLIIDNIGNKFEYSDDILMSNFEDILSGNKKKYLYDEDRKRMNKILLSSLYVTVFGISTFVINKEFVESKIEENDYLKDFITYSKPVTIKNSERTNKLRKHLIGSLKNLNKECENYKKCSSEKGKEYLKGRIQSLRKSIVELTNEYSYISNFEKQQFDPDSIAKAEIRVLEEHIADLETINYILEDRADYEGKTFIPDDSEMKKYEKQIQDIKDKYVFDRCYNDIDKLNLIRNSLSHAGRVSTQIRNDGLINISFSDYDDKNHLSGCSFCNYRDFVSSIDRLFNDEKVKVKK